MIEAAIVLGVAYGLVEHAGHGGAHLHAQHAEAGYGATGIEHRTLDRSSSTSSSSASASHD